MAPLIPCCQDPPTLAQAPAPFSQIIALGFYDGPTSGVLRCTTCLAEYKFDMLDWDADHEVRIMRLASLPAGSLARCVAALTQTEPPRWPVWVPSRSSLPSEEARDKADAAVEGILAQAKPAELIVAWVGYGERILAARKVPAKDLNAVPDWFSQVDPARDGNWFAVLGLAKDQEQQIRTGD